MFEFILKAVTLDNLAASAADDVGGVCLAVDVSGLCTWLVASEGFYYADKLLGIVADLLRLSPKQFSNRSGNKLAEAAAGDQTNDCKTHREPNNIEGTYDNKSAIA
ncbi:MAG: hypothetical protein KAJ07_10310 [Planctomycetes bacterium]|nr:hypothetical protein [Planctomycetota bacterium]